MNRTYIRRPHIIIEILSYAVILMSLIAAIYLCMIVDGEIPTHMKFDGTVDEYGSVYSSLITPIIMLFTNGMLSLIMHFYPVTSWNLPVKVTNPEKAPYVYNDCVWLMVLIMLLMGVMTLGMTVGTFFGGPAMTIGAAVPCIAMFAIIIVYIVKMIKDNR